MFDQTITVFNYYKSKLGDMWYPTTIRNVQLTIDRANMMEKFGANSRDSAQLNIHYDVVDDSVFVDGKMYLPPKEWENQTNDLLTETMTFSNVKDFFIIGEYDNNPVSDDDFIDGFYNHLNVAYDNVYTITTIGKYNAIPSFQILGA